MHISLKKAIKKVLTFILQCCIITKVADDSDNKTIKCASGSVVEHLLAKERVAGSIPVSRLEKIRDIERYLLFFSSTSCARSSIVYVSLRSAQFRGPPDLLRRLALGKNKRYRKISLIFFEHILCSKFDCLRCRSGRCITNVPRTFCNVSRSR